MDRVTDFEFGGCAFEPRRGAFPEICQFSAGFPDLLCIRRKAGRQSAVCAV